MQSEKVGPEHTMIFMVTLSVYSTEEFYRRRQSPYISKLNVYANNERQN
jgi:hypothetical protein